MLEKNDTQLMIVDVQGKLAQIMHDRDALFGHLHTMTKAALLMDLPIVWVEQIPEKLGKTINEISDELPDRKAIAKTSFSAWKEAAVRRAVDPDKKHILLVGIEAHICVYQTAIDLLSQGFHVHLVTDAISSRTPENKALAIQRLTHAGATLTSTEMALFELQKTAEGDQFRALLKIIK
ncbi:hydrolase [Vibrio methylphosphonaticus]|uniref:hydrolase n=1 Tax=Vibrio methylphosphonaticus TaxID=2946866 RepID=UPI00202A057F|nr:hydrolase [Vibrio methylphosphonaticus]MCL9776928.1 hydrolase [Vibrio methylphosphonaticus]